MRISIRNLKPGHLILVRNIDGDHELRTVAGVHNERDGTITVDTEFDGQHQKLNWSAWDDVELVCKGE